NRQQLQTLKLNSGFTGANLTITAKRTSNGGNGFVNVGFLDASEIDLGAVSIAGDLSRIAVGTASVDSKVPALRSLTVNSLGLLGVSTPAGVGNSNSEVMGSLPKLTVKDDLRSSLFVFGSTDGKLGKVRIGGSLTPFQEEILISANAGIGSRKINGDLRCNGSATVRIITEGPIGAVSVGGNILGAGSVLGFFAQISAFGQLVAHTSGR